MADRTRRVEVALRVAQAGASVAMDSYREEIATETKSGPTDLVTEIDRNTQARIVELLGESYPDEPVIGEEADARKTVPDSGGAWIVDPIDGTSNYVHGTRTWCVSVCCVIDGVCVAAVNCFPALGDTYVAGPETIARNDEPIGVSDTSSLAGATITPALYGHDGPSEDAAALATIVEQFGDVRYAGSTQAHLSRVASGAIDVAVSNVNHHPWDTVAGAYLVKRAGGTVTDLNGNPWDYTAKSLVASNGDLHEKALAIVGAALDG
ncbi:inositol monophosphatase family protein [Halocatena halophila]|uniref:inositol monophosphatase family protein n=1 Tax=Halocatena halophila TaxID=2814576 RepID=UPI002ED0A950